MLVKRRDNRNRILRDRESQNKDGRYRYTYYENGKHKSIYSWKLEPTDRLPTGKMPDLSLREKVAELQKKQLLYGSYRESSITVVELVERYLEQKAGVRHSTRISYNTILNILKNDPFGRRQIKDIKISDAKMWFVKLQNEGRGYSSIQNIRGVLRPAFRMAVDDDLLIKNVFDFELKSIIVNDSKQRQAISEEQEKLFLDFIKNDKIYRKYYDPIYILLHTGLRISEFCGLTLSDVDMKERKITVNHQLHRVNGEGYIITETKTKSGTRVLPMNSEVYACFERVIERRRKPKREPKVGTYKEFLFLDKNGKPKVALHWEHHFQSITKKYNDTHKVPLPVISPHVCRHTYCTNMALSGMNPKVLQYLMGHAEFATTMNVYTHVGYEDAKAEMEKVG